MKILCWHVNYIEWRPTKEIKPISEPATQDWDGMENCVACLIAYEKKDEENENIIEDAKNSIKEVISQVKVNKIVLYPYAHLSSSLGSAKKAKQVLNKLKEEFEKEGFEVKKAPFGWYKEFKVHCKGHPLAEARREC